MNGAGLTSMLVTLSVLLALTVLAVLIGLQQRWSNDVAQLGSVSERWLAEHRASHPL